MSPSSASTEDLSVDFYSSRDNDNLSSRTGYNVDICSGSSQSWNVDIVKINWTKILNLVIFIVEWILISILALFYYTLAYTVKRLVYARIEISTQSSNSQRTGKGLSLLKNMSWTKCAGKCSSRKNTTYAKKLRFMSLKVITTEWFRKLRLRVPPSSTFCEIENVKMRGSYIYSFAADIT